VIGIALALLIQARDPLVPEGATVKLSPHVYFITDNDVPLVPNVGIIVGSRATLVVDTGLGVRNGQTILREVQKVSTNADLFIVSTHFHPEHALGENAFPAGAKLIRARTQQQDIDEFGLTLANQFSQRSAATKQLLDGASYRKADIVFERERTIDLGGVHVRLMELGPTHTRGDTVAFVEEEKVLFAGDIVMNGTFVAFASPYSSVKAWLAALDRVIPLQPAVIVPSHGSRGDATLALKQRDCLTLLQSRVRALAAENKPEAEITDTVIKELQAKYPDWANAARIAPAVKSALSER
jgi:glyoxylase-like metal-dependent hydrolase (beta-lactamase superfamily II)